MDEWRVKEYVCARERKRELMGGRRIVYLSVRQTYERREGEGCLEMKGLCMFRDEGSMHA